MLELERVNGRRACAKYWIMSGQNHSKSESIHKRETMLLQMTGIGDLI